MVFFFSFLILIWLDHQLNLILNPYIDIEVERLTNNIVNREVHKQMKEITMLPSTQNQNFSKFEKLSYNTWEINQLKIKIAGAIEDTLSQLENGKMDEYFLPKRIQSGRFQAIRGGIVCDVSIGSLRGSTMFANIGPTIPIKLTFTGQVQSDVDVEVKEYGLNSAFVEVVLVFQIKEQVSMPLSSRQKTIVVKEPISMDIIQGDVPRYYSDSFQ